MALLVLATGLFICAVGGLMLVKPFILMPLGERIFASNWIYAAALARFLLGVLLIAAAPAVAHSITVEAFGWLFVLGGLLLVAVPRATVAAIFSRVRNVNALTVRCAALAAGLFGGFFIYAALV